MKRMEKKRCNLSDAHVENLNTNAHIENLILTVFIHWDDVLELVRTGTY